MRKILPNLHFGCTVLLAILAVPAIRHLHLPARLDWRGMLAFYWLGLGPRSLLYAVAFCLAAFPMRQTVVPLFKRYRKEKLRIAFALLFLIIVHYWWPLVIAGLLTANALLVVELVERNKLEGDSFYKRAISVFACAAYLFVGVSLVLVYNDIIVASRFPLSYDAVLNHIDMSILRGQTVSSVAHCMVTTLPRRLLVFLDFAYFQMFLVVGGAFMITAYASLKRGLQFVGTCLSAYYVTLLIFYIWPTYGPYLFCGTHATQFPSYLMSYTFQISGIPHLHAIVQQKSRFLASGYYIAFPSMHIGLPAIAMWFMRNWRPVFWFLAAYVCLIASAIVILEWHYLLDIPGGIAIAALAVALMDNKVSGNVTSN